DIAAEKSNGTASLVEKMLNCLARPAAIINEYGGTTMVRRKIIDENNGKPELIDVLDILFIDLAGDNHPVDIPLKEKSRDRFIFFKLLRDGGEQDIVIQFPCFELRAQKYLCVEWFGLT